MNWSQIDAFADLLPGAADAVAQPLRPGQTEVLAQLAQWSDLGWIRRLDRAFAAFLCDVVPDTDPLVLLAAAIVARMEGQGHACLAIDALVPILDDKRLAWPAAATPALHALLARMPRDAADWLAVLRNSPVIYAEGVQGAVDGFQPLVLDARGCLYLRRHWRAERHVAQQVSLRVAREFSFDPDTLRGWLDRLFGPADGRPDWQRLACGVAARRGLTLVTGGPGTGKTYTAARLLALLWALHPQDGPPLQVALAAPTGKAAARLRQAIDGALEGLSSRLGHALPLKELAGRLGAARTLHALLGARSDSRKFRHDALNPLLFDVLIVDEASMIHLEMMAALLDAVRPQARVILLGDKDQLASVEAGAVLGDLCRQAAAGCYDADTQQFAESVVGMEIPLEFRSAGPALAQQTVMLRESRRFTGVIGRLALAVNRGDAAQALQLLRDPPDGTVHWTPRSDRFSPAMVVQMALHGRAGVPVGHGAYLDLLSQRPAQGDPEAHAGWVRAVLAAFERFRLLCAVRDGDWGVTGLNDAIERALVQEGRMNRLAGGDWYEGRPVMVTRNDPSLGVFNGDVGLALTPPGSAAALRVYFMDAGTVRSVAASRLARVETAFAMTVHKSQGSEFEHTALVLPDVQASRQLTRELLYTGITRARSALSLLGGQTSELEEILARITLRGSGLPHALDSE